MEIQNASTTPSNSNQLQNILRWESRNVTAQPWEIYEVIAFVVNACINDTANNFYI